MWNEIISNNQGVSLIYGSEPFETARVSHARQTLFKARGSDAVSMCPGKSQSSRSGLNAPNGTS